MVQIQGRKGWYRFLYSDERNNDCTCWGPVKKDGKATQKGQFVSVNQYRII